MRDKINGYCPMGCGQTLYRGDTFGHVVCRDEDCPRSTAVAELLADRESEHVVLLGTGGWTIRHPLRERLDDALLGCELAGHVTRVGETYPIGRYRVVGGDEHGRTWQWERIDE